MVNQILVLGAGIQGVCVALALRQRGSRVTLIDRMPDLMLRTSLRNEGKIHLGFVYANDASFQTSALMLRAALNFSSLFDTWLEMPVDWRALTSTPFVYLIARDSMLAPEQIYAHYARLQEYFRQWVADGEPAIYLGIDLGNRLHAKNLWQRAPREMIRWFAADRVAECIETVELALDRARFREIVRARLEAFPEIETRFGYTIQALERTASGFRVRGTRADGTRWQLESDSVVNCLWDGRLALDAQLDIFPTRPFVMRLKYRLVGEIALALTALPSLTMVLGRYGDVVTYPNAPTHFSWYPTCLRGWSNTPTPPVEWEDVCAGKADPAIAAQVAREMLAAFEQIIPGIAASRIETIDAGVIYSWGETDIDDYASALHQRHEIGFTAHDGNYSIDTGKFTCAPYFAQELVNHVQKRFYPTSTLAHWKSHTAQHTFSEMGALSKYLVAPARTFWEKLRGVFVIAVWAAIRLSGDFLFWTGMHARWHKPLQRILDRSMRI